MYVITKDYFNLLILFLVDVFLCKRREYADLGTEKQRSKFIVQLMQNAMRETEGVVR